MKIIRRVSFIASLITLSLLTGCGAHSAFNASTAQATTLTGRVHGGQQPVAYSTIQLYTVGTSGDGSASTPLLTQSVQTDASGNFSITGLYPCTNATQVYLTANGGDAGVGAPNNNLRMMTALGSCTALQTTAYVTINELTTVAAVNALAPYMTSMTSVGSGSGDVAALDAAFVLANEFANPYTGMSGGLNVPAGYVVPVREINTLGDAVAGCINTGGGTANDGTGCGKLFQYTTPVSGTAPTDTVTALLNLAKNPTLNTGYIYPLALPISPFQPTLSVQPASFAVALTATTTLQVSPASITFPISAVGYAASQIPVTLYNPNVAPVTISSIALTGANTGSFTTTSGCSLSVPLTLGQSCVVEVTATPSALTTQTASLVVTSNAAGSPQSVPLSVTGEAAVPGAIGVSTTSLSWQTARTFQDITLTNSGTIPLAYTASVGTSYFDVDSSSTCAGVVPAQGSCVLTVESTGFYTAYGTGGAPYVYTDTLTISSAATNGAKSVSLRSQNANEMVVPMYSPGISFGSVTAGTYGFVSEVLSVLPIYASAGISGQITFGGLDANNFNDPDTTPTQGGSGLLGSGQCNISGNGCAGNIVLQTLPNKPVGPIRARLYLGSGYINLTASIVPAPTFTLGTPAFSPSLINGGTETTTGTITLTNTGTTPINPTSFAFGGMNPTNYSVTGNTCSNLVPSASCTISLAFSATVAGAYPATFTATDTVSGSYVTASLSVTAAYATMTVTPNTIAFGNQPINTISNTVTVQVADPNGNPLNHVIQAYNAYSPFTISSVSCPASSTQVCYFTFAFAPTSPVASTEQVQIYDYTSSSSQFVTLSGTGTGSAPVLTLSATQISFPSTYTGTSATPISLTLTNTGTANMTISSIALSGTITNGNFAETNNCPTTLAVGAYCTIVASFNPSATGYQSVLLAITTNTATPTTYLTVSGTGLVGPIVTLSPNFISFPSTSVGTTAAPGAVTLKNTGTTGLAISSVSLSGGVNGNYTLADYCPASLAAGSSCNIFAYFAPTATGYQTASIQIVSNALSSPNTIALSGTGQ